MASRAPELIVVRDEAFTPDEYASWRRQRERENARKRERRRTDPQYAARRRAYERAYREAHRDDLNVYKREWKRRQSASIPLRINASLHDVGCHNDPCRCQPIYGHVEREP